MASPLKGRAVAKAIEVIIPRGSCEDVLSSPPRVNQPSRGSGRARAKAVAEQNFAACAQLQKDVEAAKVRCQRPLLSPRRRRCGVCRRRCVAEESCSSSSARGETFCFGSVGFDSVGLVWVGSVRFGLVRFGSVGLV